MPLIVYVSIIATYKKQCLSYCLKKFNNLEKYIFCTDVQNLTQSNYVLNTIFKLTYSTY